MDDEVELEELAVGVGQAWTEQLTLMSTSGMMTAVGLVFVGTRMHSGQVDTKVLAVFEPQKVPSVIGALAARVATIAPEIDMPDVLRKMAKEIEDFPPHISSN